MYLKLLFTKVWRHTVKRKGKGKEKGKFARAKKWRQQVKKAEFGSAEYRRLMMNKPEAAKDW